MPLEPGSTFAGKYRIESTIGVGGMGMVFAAVHLGLDQRVALKVLQPELARHQTLVQRFVREAKAVAKISGDHVVKVFDVGTSEGTPFIVLELLRGVDLAELVATRGPMLERDAVDAVIEACHAIAQAHAVGVVHRDLKPSNLFLATAEDGSTAIKVLDFGISKLIETENDDIQVTRTRDVFGSPSYMSPEQLRASRDVDGRSDIWSLGVVLFELLTASTPFEGESPMAVGGAILHGEPTSLRARRADASEALEHVIRTCLRKNANERYATAAELVNALAPFASSRGQALVSKVDRISQRSLSDMRDDSSRPLLSDPPAPTVPAPLESAPTFLIPHSQGTNGTWTTPDYASPGRGRAVVAGGLGLVVVAAVVLTVSAVMRKPQFAPSERPVSEPATSASVHRPAAASTVAVVATTSAFVSESTALPVATTSVPTKPLRGRHPPTTHGSAHRTAPANPVSAPAPTPPATVAPVAVPTAADRVRDRHGMDE